MDARHHIITLLQEWLELTRGESHAIQVSRWSDLAKIQRTKAAMQQPLLDATEQWKAENPGEAALGHFLHKIYRLLDLETHNGELLAVRKRKTREKIFLLEQALYDFRHIRSTHARTPQAA
jgi:hypothetical protein